MITKALYLFYLLSVGEPKYATVVQVSRDSILYFNGYEYQKSKLLYSTSNTYVFKEGCIYKYNRKLFIKFLNEKSEREHRIIHILDYTKQN